MSVTHEASDNKPSRVGAAVTRPVFVLKTASLPAVYLYRLALLEPARPDSGTTKATLFCLRILPKALVYHSVPPSLHHWYLMRWHHTSRFIGSVQTNPHFN